MLLQSISIVDSSCMYKYGVWVYYVQNQFHAHRCLFSSIISSSMEWRGPHFLFSYVLSIEFGFTVITVLWQVQWKDVVAQAVVVVSLLKQKFRAIAVSCQCRHELNCSISLWGFAFRSLRNITIFWFQPILLPCISSWHNQLFIRWPWSKYMVPTINSSGSKSRSNWCFVEITSCAHWIFECTSQYSKHFNPMLNTLYVGLKWGTKLKLVLYLICIPLLLH